MSPAFDLSVYLVTGPVAPGRTLVDTVAAAVTGGATMVQLRDKEASDAEMVETGRAVMRVLGGTGVPLIVNDRLGVALEIGADGLHVGQGDLAPQTARESLGARRILGLTVETPEQASRIDPDLVDYAGAGPVAASATKPSSRAPLGGEGLAARIAPCPVPVVAIGGLGAEHAETVVAAGAQGMAVVSAICSAPDPELAAAQIAAALRSARAARKDRQ